MTRSYWNGVMAMVAAVGMGGGVCLTLAQTPAPSGDRYISIGAGNQKQRCQVLQTWMLPSGGTAYQTRAVETGEIITIVRGDGDDSTKKEVSVRIFRWVKGIPPNGTPVAPAVSTPPPAAVAVPIAPAPSKQQVENKPSAAPVTPIAAVTPARPLAPIPPPVASAPVRPLPASSEEQEVRSAFPVAPTPPPISWAAVPKNTPAQKVERPAIDPTIDSMGQAPWAKSELKIAIPGKTTTGGALEECEPRSMPTAEAPRPVAELPLPRPLPSMSDYPRENNLPAAPTVATPVVAAPVAPPVVAAPIAPPPVAPIPVTPVPQAPAYVAPQTPVYAAPQAPAYVAPQPPVYVAPQTPVYAAPQAPAYVAPQAPVYVAPQPPPQPAPAPLPPAVMSQPMNAIPVVHAPVQTLPLPRTVEIPRPAPSEIVEHEIIEVPNDTKASLYEQMKSGFASQHVPSATAVPVETTVTTQLPTAAPMTAMPYARPAFSGNYAAAGFNRSAVSVTPTAIPQPQAAPQPMPKGTPITVKTAQGSYTIIEVREPNATPAPLAQKRPAPAGFDRTLTSIGVNPAAASGNPYAQPPGNWAPAPAVSAPATYVPAPRTQTSSLFSGNRSYPNKETIIEVREAPAAVEQAPLAQRRTPPSFNRTISSIGLNPPVSYERSTIYSTQANRPQPVQYAPVAAPASRTIIIDERPQPVVQYAAPASQTPYVVRTAPAARPSLLEYLRNANRPPEERLPQGQQYVIVEQPIVVPQRSPLVHVAAPIAAPIAAVASAPVTTPVIVPAAVQQAVAPPVAAPAMVQAPVAVPAPAVVPAPTIAQAPAAPPAIAPEIVQAPPPTPAPSVTPTVAPAPTIAQAPTVAPAVPAYSQMGQPNTTTPQTIIINTGRPGQQTMPNMMTRPGETPKTVATAPQPIPMPVIINGPSDSNCTVCTPSGATTGLEAAGKAGGDWTSLRDRLKTMVGAPRSQPSATPTGPETIVVISETVVKPGDDSKKPVTANANDEVKGPSTAMAAPELKMLDTIKPLHSVKPAAIAKTPEIINSLDTAKVSTDIAPPPAMGGERIVTVGVGKEKLSCRVVQTWTTPGGGQAHLVKTVDTNDMITVVREATSATDSAEQPARVYRWADAKTSPAGAPVPPPLPVPPTFELAKVAPTLESSDTAKDATSTLPTPPAMPEGDGVPKTLPNIAATPVPNEVANNVEKPGMASTHPERPPLVTPIPSAIPNGPITHVTLAIPANPSMDRPAIVFTAAVNDPRVISQLIQAAKESAHPFLREEAVIELAKYDGRKNLALATILNQIALTDSAPAVRAAAINALVQMNAPAALAADMLETLRNDADVRVRFAANEATTAFGLNTK